MAKPTEAVMTRFYGLPKIHKPGVPLRSIVSLRGTPTYGLANGLFQKVRCLKAGSQTTVHSAEQFLDKIKVITIEPNERMVSFDVTSLFTSIPRVLAVQTVRDLLHQHNDENEGQLTAHYLIDLLEHCLKTSFTFEGITYEQIRGTPIGSPICGLIAEIVLQKLERWLFEEDEPKFWARYVDETFVIIDQHRIAYYKERLNSILPDLHFTLKEGVEGRLPFLDVLVCRQPDGKMATSVYQKSTNMLQMLSYNSNHPMQHNRSCIHMLH
uniref:Reverse transcriptase (RNA-dependent DNA polymerase) n=1 Tax=Schistocephalus solidus TaxID=70667 RepID=A0A0X3Q762_SCHSO